MLTDRVSKLLQCLLELRHIHKDVCSCFCLGMDGRTAPRTAAMDTFRLGSERGGEEGITSL